jgi:hypothetical protein
MIAISDWHDFRPWSQQVSTTPARNPLTGASRATFELGL